MKAPTLADLLSTFFVRYLAAERGVSPHTLVLDFLADLETNRGNTIRTRNARLAAIQTFFRYVMGREPALAALCSPVLAIPAKKAIHPVLGYLNEQGLDHILRQVDRSARNGERDYALLSLLYDTGARIQELLDLAPCNFHLEAPPFVRARGNGLIPKKL